MRSFLYPIRIATLCASVLAASPVHAHYLWIEKDDAGARLYYGEADTLLKEKSPGKLDSIKAPQAFSFNAEGHQLVSASINRANEYFAINSGKAATAVAVKEETLEVRDLTKYGLGMAKSNYYARHGQPALPGKMSSLALDVQDHGPNTFAVLYRGQPLQNAKLEVIAPNTWIQEHQTNEQGIVSINTPWRGQYVMHILHVDKANGAFQGQKYDSLRNHFTYTFINSQGTDPGPAVPPKKPLD